MTWPGNFSLQTDGGPAFVSFCWFLSFFFHPILCFFFYMQALAKAWPPAFESIVPFPSGFVEVVVRVSFSPFFVFFLKVHRVGSPFDSCQGGFSDALAPVGSSIRA